MILACATVQRRAAIGAQQRVVAGVAVQIDAAHRVVALAAIRLQGIAIDNVVARTSVDRGGATAGEDVVALFTVDRGTALERVVAPSAVHHVAGTQRNNHIVVWRAVHRIRVLGDLIRRRSQRDGRDIEGRATREPDLVDAVSQEVTHHRHPIRGAASLDDETAVVPIQAQPGCIGNVAELEHLD